jgi:hypothetical protein
MAKTLTLSFNKWQRLQEKIIEDYGRTTVLISWRLRDTLGFTIREHRDYTNKEYNLTHTVRLDFWDDCLQTMFLLRYSDFLDSQAS